MGKWRCENENNEGLRCLLAPEHQGKTPCRFKSDEIIVTVHPNTPAARRAVAPLVKALAAAGPDPLRKKQLRQPELVEMHISIPLTPPSVNHYKIPRRGGKGFVLTAAARAFINALGSLTTGSVRADWYEITTTVYMRKGQKGDADNFNKVALDGLVRNGIITSDHRVKATAVPERDWNNPRTEIVIREWKR